VKYSNPFFPSAEKISPFFPPPLPFLFFLRKAKRLIRLFFPFLFSSFLGGAALFTFGPSSRRRALFSFVLVSTVSPFFSFLSLRPRSAAFSLERGFKRRLFLPSFPPSPSPFGDRCQRPATTPLPLLSFFFRRSSPRSPFPLFFEHETPRRPFFPSFLFRSLVRPKRLFFPPPPSFLSAKARVACFFFPRGTHRGRIFSASSLRSVLVVQHQLPR